MITAKGVSLDFDRYDKTNEVILLFEISHPIKDELNIKIDGEILGEFFANVTKSVMRELHSYVGVE